MKFDEIEEKLGRDKAEVSALHGLITGWLSAGARWVEADDSDVFTEWLGADSATATFKTVTADMAGDIGEGLRDIDLGFKLFLPDEEVGLNARQRCISQWCGGFLSAFGMSGRFLQHELEEEITEVLADLAKISAVDEELSDNEDNEGDLMEITEYVRMAALLVFTECGSKTPH